MSGPPGPSGSDIPGLPSNIGASQAPAMTMDQMAFLMHTMMAKASPAPPVAPAPAPAPVPEVRMRERSGVWSHRTPALDAAARSLPVLKEGAYMGWSYSIRDTLQSVGLWKYVTGKVVCPANRTSREYDLYELKSAAVRSAIVGALDCDIMYRYLQGVVDPKDVWALLKRHYCASDKMTLVSIDGRLQGLRLQEGGNVIEHVATLRRLCRELDGTKFEVTAERACELLIRSVPTGTSYNNWVSNMEQDNNDNFEHHCMTLETHYWSILACSSPNTLVGAHPASVQHSYSARPESTHFLPPDLAKCRITGARNTVWLIVRGLPAGTACLLVTTRILRSAQSTRSVLSYGVQNNITAIVDTAATPLVPVRVRRLTLMSRPLPTLPQSLPLLSSLTRMLLLHLALRFHRSPPSLRRWRPMFQPVFLPVLPHPWTLFLLTLAVRYT